MLPNPGLDYHTSIMGKDCSCFNQLLQASELSRESQPGPSSVQGNVLSEEFPFEEEIVGAPSKTRKTRSQKQEVPG